MLNTASESYRSTHVQVWYKYLKSQFGTMYIMQLVLSESKLGLLYGQVPTVTLVGENISLYPAHRERVPSTYCYSLIYGEETQVVYRVACRKLPGNGFLCKLCASNRRSYSE